MVLKTELCLFSGQKIYPGRGIRFIRFDSQILPQQVEAIEAYMFRKQHRKDIATENVRRRRATKKPYSRSIVGATLEVIQKKRAEKPEFVMQPGRQLFDFEIKDRIKKTKDEKKAKKAEVTTKAPKAGGKVNVSKGAGPKVKMGGGGGKH